jgi:hypothetical protein
VVGGGWVGKEKGGEGGREVCRRERSVSMARLMCFCVSVCLRACVRVRLRVRVRVCRRVPSLAVRLCDAEIR